MAKDEQENANDFLLKYMNKDEVNSSQINKTWDHLNIEDMYDI